MEADNWFHERDIGSDLTRYEILKLMGYDPTRKYVIKLREKWSLIRYNKNRNMIELIEAGEREPTYFIDPSELKCKNDAAFLTAAFAGIVDQLRTIQNAYSIASRFAQNMGYYITFKDFLSLIKVLSEPVTMKTVKFQVEPGKTLDIREKRRMEEELRHLRLNLLESLHKLQEARDTFDSIVESLEHGDLYVTAEMQKRAANLLDRAELHFENLLKKYISMEESLMAREGFVIYEDAGREPVVELIPIDVNEKKEEENKEEEEQVDINPKDLKIDVDQKTLDADVF